MVDTPAKSADDLTVGMLAQRLNGMDKAIELLQATVDKMPTPALVQADVDALREITEERFKGVAAILAERQKQVESALTAQKESATKTELSFGDRIHQTAELLTTKTGAIENSLGVVSTRLTMVESRTMVTKEVSSDSRALIFAVVGAVVGVGGLIGVIYGVVVALGG